MSYSTNFRDKSLKELKDICRSDSLKYRGFSKLNKDDLVNFMYRMNSPKYTQRPFQRGPRRVWNRGSHYLSDVSHIFETPEESEERIQSYYEPKPEDTIIQDLISSLQSKYPESNVVFDPYNDENNDMIYRGNKAKYISQHGSLGEHGEGILYHGTDEKNLLSILNDDFRLTSNPVHGDIYGKGIYFTNDIEKAIYYSERGKSTKFIIVCNVHIGDICQGYSRMDIHPKMPNLDKPYDTSVDNIHSPKQFIKKKNGTYNIIGIIKIENHIDKSNKRFTGGFQLVNTKNHPITLYWVPPNTTRSYCGVPILQMCKKMSDIPASIIGRHGTTRQLCQLGHEFICVYHHIKEVHFIRVFKSTKKGEVITI